MCSWLWNSWVCARRVLVVAPRAQLALQGEQLGAVAQGGHGADRRPRSRTGCGWRRAPGRRAPPRVADLGVVPEQARTAGIEDELIDAAALDRRRRPSSSRALSLTTSPAVSATATTPSRIEWSSASRWSASARDGGRRSRACDAGSGANRNEPATPSPRPRAAEVSRSAAPPARSPHVGYGWATIAIPTSWWSSSMIGAWAAIDRAPESSTSPGPRPPLLDKCCRAGRSAVAADEVAADQRERSGRRGRHRRLEVVAPAACRRSRRGCVPDPPVARTDPGRPRCWPSTRPPRAAGRPWCHGSRRRSAAPRRRWRPRRRRAARQLEHAELAGEGRRPPART